MFKDVKVAADKAKKKGKKETAAQEKKGGVAAKIAATNVAQRPNEERGAKAKKNRKERRKDQRKERRRDIKKRVKEEKAKLVEAGASQQTNKDVSMKEE